MATTTKDTKSTRDAKSAAAKAAYTARTQALKQVAATKQVRPIGGFTDFIREQGVVGLAIGLALGTQVKALVDQIVISFINPIVGLILPGEGDLSKKVFHLTVGHKVAQFGYGQFLNVMISFVAVAAVIYFVVKGLGLDKIDKER